MAPVARQAGRAGYTGGDPPGLSRQPRSATLPPPRERAPELIAVPTSDPARRPDPSLESAASFVLYVEGARDRSILRAWAQRLMPAHATALFEEAVILGGRRPARALDHFRRRAAGSQAVCVLDRDGGDAAAPPDAEGGLRFFTWGRRHIESYLLVPAAIRRALADSDALRQVEAILEPELPRPDDDAAWRAFDAKRLLGAKGPLARVLGHAPPLARIARCTRPTELHADVHAVFEHLQQAVARTAPARPRRPRLRPHSRVP